MTDDAADRQWSNFIGDAATVLSVSEELHEAVPALIEEPFNPATQARVTELLRSDRMTRANAAARRLVVSKTPASIEGA